MGETDINPAPEWLQCAGKEPYDSPQLARNVAKRRNRSKRYGVNRKHHAAPLAAYHCPHCGKWHLGTQSGRLKNWTKR